MYSRKIIDRNLDLFEAKEGWRPVAHTFGQVEEFKERMNKWVTLDSNSKNTYISKIAPMTARLRKEISHWIENEIIMCSFDYSYWRDNYAYCINETGRKKKFQNRKSQDVFDKIIGYLEEKQASIQLLCLKGRQVGITTLVSLYFSHKMWFVPDTLAVMASVQKSKSDEIEVKLNTAYEECPYWIMPKNVTKRSWSNGSRLMIESGMQPKGISQGQTPQLVHISEIGLIPNPHNVIEEGLLPATHSFKELFMVFEGTGSGNTGWFPDFWRSQKEKWPFGTGRMCPIFIPWHLATDMYPQADWIRAHPVPPGFYENRLTATKAHIARCESYVRNTPFLADVVGHNYTVPIEQQYWWELEYVQAKERHSLQQHAARLPADDFEALTGVHDSVFDPEVIRELEENIYEVIGETGQKIRKSPMEVYSIIGHSIDEKYYPDKRLIDKSKSVIHVTWKSHRGEKYDWDMIPLFPVDENVETDTMDKLLVYEPPVRGANYSCGIDTAHGLGKENEERTCISVCRNRTGNEYDSQVCELTSNRLNPAQTVPFAACIAAWYGEVMDDYRGVKFAIEQVQGPGDTCQNQLKIMGFNYHHRLARYDGKKVKDENKNREGWYSNSVNVAILMTRFIEAMNGGWYKPASKWLIEECRTLERHTVDSGKDKMVHRQGSFDDRVRAAAQSYFTVHDLDDLAARSQKRYALPERKFKNTGDGRAGLISVGDWDDE